MREPAIARAIALAAGAGRRVMPWRFTDRGSWAPRSFPGTGAATVCDQDFRPKPAYRALQEGLRRPAAEAGPVDPR